MDLKSSTLGLVKQKGECPNCSNHIITEEALNEEIQMLRIENCQKEDSINQLTFERDYNERKILLLVTDLQKLTMQLKLEREIKKKEDDNNLREAKDIISYLEEIADSRQQEIHKLQNTIVQLDLALKEKSLKPNELTGAKTSKEQMSQNLISNIELTQCRNLNNELSTKISKLKEEKCRLSLSDDYRRKELIEMEQSFKEALVLLKKKDSTIVSLRDDVKQLEGRIGDLQSDLLEVRDIHETSLMVDSTCPSRLSIDQIVKANNLKVHVNSSVEKDVNKDSITRSDSNSRTKISMSFKRLINDNIRMREGRINELDESVNCTDRSDNTAGCTKSRVRLSHENCRRNGFETYNEVAVHQTQTMLVKSVGESGAEKNPKPICLSQSIQTEDIVLPQMKEFDFKRPCSDSYKSSVYFRSYPANIATRLRDSCTSPVSQLKLVDQKSFGCQTDICIRTLDSCQAENGCQSNSHPLLVNSAMSYGVSHGVSRGVSCRCQTDNVVVRSSFGCQTEADKLQQQSDGCQTDIDVLNQSGCCQTDNNVSNKSGGFQTNNNVSNKFGSFPTDDAVRPSLCLQTNANLKRQQSEHCQTHQTGLFQQSNSCQTDIALVHCLNDKSTLVSIYCQTDETPPEYVKECDLQMSNTEQSKAMEEMRKEKEERELEIRQLRKEVHTQRLRVLDVKHDTAEQIIALKLQISGLNESILNAKSEEEERMLVAEGAWNAKLLRLNGQVEEMIDRCRLLEAESETLKEERERACKRQSLKLEGCAQELEVREKAVVMLQEAYKRLQDDFDTVVTKVERVEAQFAEYRKVTEVKVAELNRSLNGVRTEAEQLKMDRDTFKRKYDELKELSTQMERHMDTYKTAIDKQDKIIKRRSENAAMNLKPTIEDSLNEGTQIQLNLDISNLTKEIQRLSCNLTSLQLENEQLKQSIVESRKKEEDFLKTQEKLFSTENQLISSKMKVDQMTQELGDQKRLIDSINEKSKRKLSQMAIEGDSYKKAVDEKESKVSQLVDQFKMEALARKKIEDDLSELTSRYKKLRSEMDAERHQSNSELELKNKTIVDLNNQLMEVEKTKTLLQYDFEKLLASSEVAEVELNMLKEEVSKELTRLQTIKSENKVLSEELGCSKNINAGLQRTIDLLQKDLFALKSMCDLSKIRYEETILQQTKLIDFLKTKLENTPRKKRLFSGNRPE